MRLPQHAHVSAPRLLLAAAVVAFVVGLLPVGTLARLLVWSVGLVLASAAHVLTRPRGAHRA